MPLTIPSLLLVAALVSLAGCCMDCAGSPAPPQRNADMPVPPPPPPPPQRNTNGVVTTPPQ